MRLPANDDGDDQKKRNKKSVRDGGTARACRDRHSLCHPKCHKDKMYRAFWSEPPLAVPSKTRSGFDSKRNFNLKSAEIENGENGPPDVAPPATPKRVDSPPSPLPPRSIIIINNNHSISIIGEWKLWKSIRQSDLQIHRHSKPARSSHPHQTRSTRQHPPAPSQSALSRNRHSL